MKVSTNLELPDLRRGYVELVEHLLARGRRATSRDLATLELTGVRLTFPDPLAPLLPVGVGRRVNVRLAAVEALQVIAGESRPHLLRAAAPRYDAVMVDPTDLDYGAYGPRIANALGDCLDVLRRDPQTRRAVALIWRPDDVDHDGDRPCTVFLQFLIRENDVGEDALELYVYMRSQDVWLGVPYDVFTFSQLQHTLARDLRVPAGRYVHNTTSLHLYQHDLDAARDLVGRRGQLNDGDANELPLGVASTEDGTSGLEVASYLLDDVDPGRVKTASNAERAANRWYAARLTEVVTPRIVT